MAAASNARRSSGVAILLLAAFLVGGCQRKPRAPALIDEPVYQSDEGFRFLVPDGWIMSARGNAPPGRIEKERLLVQYHRVQGDSPATLEVSLLDMPEDDDLSAYLSQPSFSARRWEQKGKPESLKAGGVAGQRFLFTAQVKGNELAKEVTTFRRGGRVYFFTVLYSPKDATAAEQVRRSIGRLVWTK